LCKRYATGPSQLAISPITQAELYFGVLNKAELKKIRQHLSLLAQVPLDVPISAVFLQLMETYSLSHKLSLPDALIAATALVHNLELFTLNGNDFQSFPTYSFISRSVIENRVNPIKCPI